MTVITILKNIATQNTHFFIRNKITVGRPQDDLIKYPLHLAKNNDGAHQYSNSRPDNMPAQIFHMVQEVHLGLRITVSFAQEVFKDTQNTVLGCKGRANEVIS